MAGNAELKFKTYIVLLHGPTHAFPDAEDTIERLKHIVIAAGLSILTDLTMGKLGFMYQTPSDQEDLLRNEPVVVKDSWGITFSDSPISRAIDPSELVFDIKKYAALHGISATLHDEAEEQERLRGLEDQRVAAEKVKQEEN